MKFGFVLEGGAMRGIYTAGVLDVLYEAGIRPEGIIGTSAGAIHGISFISEQPGRSIRYYQRFAGDKHFMSFYSLITTGSLVGEQLCYHDIPERLDPFDYEAFAASPIECFFTATALESGQAVYLKAGNLKNEMHYLLASASMPLVSKKVWIDGAPYLDGGVADSIPEEAFRRMGYTRNLVVLTRPEGYRKKPMKMALPMLLYKKYPAFLKALEERHQNYNRQVAEVEQRAEKGEVFLIRPSQDLGIGRMEKDPQRIQAQYELGRRDAEAALPELKRWLQSLYKNGSL